MDNTEYVLSLSYGKDSLAAIYVAIEILKWRIDRIIHAEVWATDTIPADLPPMVEFKGIADETIERRWGIKVEHLCAMRNVAGGLFLYWRKETGTTHSCHSCSHCQLVEKGKDGKLIYTCGAIRGDQPKFYYDYAKPVYCGWWKKRKGWWYDHH